MTTLKELTTRLISLSERVGSDAEVQIEGEEGDWTTNFVVYEAHDMTVRIEMS